ncbi:MAG: HesA/MoeB/ThiF family protein [Bacteroidales bacterium]
MLTEREKRIFSRQIMLPDIGEEGQEAIRKARVLVVGAGGLGCPVLQYLNAAGIGSIGIVEFDMVNESNIHRQILYGGNDLGKLKSIIARDILNKLSNLTQTEVYNIRLTEANAGKIISPWDIVVDATDNYETRYVIDNVCSETGKPMIHGAIYGSEGQVSVFNYRGSGSYRSYNPKEQGRIRNPDPSQTGLFGMLPGVTGAMMAFEVIKIVTGTGEVLADKILTFNILTHRYLLTRLSRKKNDQNK